MQKNPFIGNTVQLRGSADASALKEDGLGIVLDVISPEQVEAGHLVLRQKNYKDGEEYVALEAYSGDWNERVWRIDRGPTPTLKHDDYTLTFDGNGVTYLDNSKYLFFVSENDCVITKAGSLYLRAIDTSLNPVGYKVGSVTFSAYYFS